MLALILALLNLKTMKNTVRFCELVLNQRIYHKGFYTKVVSITQKPEGYRVTTDNGSVIIGYSFDRLALKSSALKQEAALFM